KERGAAGVRYLVATALFGALVLGLFANEILVVFTRAPYLPAAPYVGFLAYVHVISAVGTVLSAGAMIGKQLGAISGSVAGAATVNMILNFLLIPRYGLWGATIATVAGVAVQPVLLYILLRRRYPVAYPMRKLLIAVVAQLGLLLVGVLIPLLQLPFRVALKLGLLALLPLTFV